MTTGWRHVDMPVGKFAKEMNVLKEHLGKHQLKFTRQR